MKCLLAPLASAALLVGLSACDEGRITDTHLAVEPATASERLTMEEKVQQRIFDEHCIQCHGGSAGTPAAGLNLTEGLSINCLIDVPSAVDPSRTLVIPGNHADSWLYEVVATDVTASWGILHSNFLDDSEKYLLATWIDLQ